MYYGGKTRILRGHKKGAKDHQTQPLLLLRSASAVITYVGRGARAQPFAQLFDIQTIGGDGCAQRIKIAVGHRVIASWFVAAQLLAHTANAPVLRSGRLLHHQERSGNVPCHGPSYGPALS